MKRLVASILLLVAPPAFASHFGPCTARETAKGKTTMCTLQDETVCVGPKLLDRKMTKGWTIGKCHSAQPCGDGICDPSIGEECSTCPADCSSSTVCCINAMGGTTTENCCDDCPVDPMTFQCVEASHSSGPGGSCVPN